MLVAPGKLVRLFGGNVLTELGWALTLAASAHAYGADLGLAQALVVNMCASIFASVMPVPGGIGVAEASLAAGMMAFGVPSSEAYAAALTHRLATFYLPPIWGWFSLALPDPQGLPVSPIDTRLKGMVHIPSGEFANGLRPLLSRGVSRFTGSRSTSSGSTIIP